MKKLNKKGAFETINAGMLTFLSFVLIVVLTIFLVSQVKQSNIVCDDTLRSGQCLSCPSGYVINTTGTVCCNSTGGVDNCYGANQTSAIFGNSAFNSTVAMQEAAALPPQFAQVIVITLIIVGIVGMLTAIGYGAYQRIKR